MTTMHSKLTSALALVTLFVSAAYALPITQPDALLSYQDIDVFGVTLSQGQSATGTFDIVSASVDTVTIGNSYANAGTNFSDLGGYVLGAPIQSATVYFYIRDGNQGNDVVTVDLNGSQLFSGSTGGTNTILSNGVSLSLLQNNGVLSYSITQNGKNNGASFTFDYAQLQVTTAVAGADSVPDSSTSLGLLGLGLVALGIVRRWCMPA